MRLLITGGGTGGHIFPGIAVAVSFQKVVDNSEVLFVSTARSMDQKIFTELNLNTSTIACSGLKGASLREKTLSLLQQPGAVLQAYKVVKKFRPDLVLGVGGYVTGPVIVAAKLRNIPVCIHEQNSIPGLANKLAGKLADKVFISMAGTKGFSPAKIIQTGNPVRDEIVQIRTQVKQFQKKLTIVALGGSQGAHRINLLIVEMMGILKRQGIDVHLIHQTGEQDYSMVSSAYKKLGLDVVVDSFIRDMASLYSKADLAISRAGATTLAELSSVGVPAILIPFPYAADDHQYYNALHYAENGGCQVFREHAVTGEKLAEIIANYVSEPDVLHAMAARMKSLGIPDAAERIVNQCLNMIKK